MVRIHPDPPVECHPGAVAQLGERLLCKQEVIGSIPFSSTRKRAVDGGPSRTHRERKQAAAFASDLWIRPAASVVL